MSRQFDDNFYKKYEEALEGLSDEQVSQVAKLNSSLLAEWVSSPARIRPFLLQKWLADSSKQVDIIPSKRQEKPLPATEQNIPTGSINPQMQEPVLARGRTPNFGYQNQNTTAQRERVRMAVRLLYATLGIGLLRMALETSEMVKTIPIELVLFAGFVSLAVVWFFVFMIAKGKNWARIIFLVLFIIGTPFSIAPLLQSLEANPLSGLLGVAQLIMLLIALAMLFQRSSSDWFNAQKDGRSVRYVHFTGEAEKTALRKKYSTLSTVELKELLKRSSDLPQGDEDIIIGELDRRRRGGPENQRSFIASSNANQPFADLHSAQKSLRSDQTLREQQTADYRVRSKSKTNRLYITVSAIGLLLFAAIGGYWLLYSDATLIPFRRGDKFGFCDKNRKLIIEAKYEDAEPFFEGLARVKLNGKYGFIDKTGKEVISPKYDDAKAAFVEMILFKDLFKSTSSLVEQPINVKLGEKWGYVDRTGREITQLIYDSPSPFVEGFAAVAANSKWGFIDKTGNEVIRPIYNAATSFIDGLAAVELENKARFIDKTGKEVRVLKYDSALPFIEELAAVETNKKWGYIDKSGNEVISVRYEQAMWFSEGLAPVKVKGEKEDLSDAKWGFIDKAGKEVIPFKYEFAGIFGFKDGLAFVKLNDKWGLIDKAGNYVIRPRFNEGKKFDFGPVFTEGVAAVMVDKKWGFIDKTGKEVIPFKYDSASPFIEGLAKVTLDSKSYYIDKRGTEY